MRKLVSVQEDDRQVNALSEDTANELNDAGIQEKLILYMPLRQTQRTHFPAQNKPQHYKRRQRSFVPERQLTGIQLGLKTIAKHAEVNRLAHVVCHIYNPGSL